MSKSLMVAAITGVALIAGAASVEAQQRTKDVEQATVTRPNGTMSKIELLKTGKRMETVNCRDFNMLAESYRPQAVVYAANYGPKGKAHPTVTVEGVEKVVPMVTASCRARPGDHFTTAVHNAMMPVR